MTFSIEVENKFESEPRDIRVCRKRWDETLEEHSVGSPAYEAAAGVIKTAGLSLEAEDGEEDYLEISLADPDTQLGPCKITLPSNVPFTFIPAGAGCINVTPFEDGENITALRIPSGPPAWRLEIMSPLEPFGPGGDGTAGISRGDEDELKNVTVGEDDPGQGG